MTSCNTSRFGYIGHPTLRVWGVLQSFYTFLHDITSRRVQVFWSISIASAQTLLRAVVCCAFFLCTPSRSPGSLLLTLHVVNSAALLSSRARKGRLQILWKKIQKDVTPRMRAILIDWLVEVSYLHQINLRKSLNINLLSLNIASTLFPCEGYRRISPCPYTLYLTVNYIDRYLSVNKISLVFDMPTTSDSENMKRYVHPR